MPGAICRQDGPLVEVVPWVTHTTTGRSHARAGTMADSQKGKVQGLRYVMRNGFARRGHPHCIIPIRVALVGHVAYLAGKRSNAWR
jgi:hypothetical protein